MDFVLYPVLPLQYLVMSLASLEVQFYSSPSLFTSLFDVIKRSNHKFMFMRHKKNKKTHTNTMIDA